VSRRGWLVCTFVLLGSLTAFPRCAFADDEATEQARKHYQEGQKQFDLGLWDTAISEFAKAYEMRPDPSFLFNMAQAYRRGGNAKRAIDLYKNYLIKLPKSPQRAEVEERIQNLQKQLDEGEREAKRKASAPAIPSLTPEPASQPGELVTPPPATTATPERTADPAGAEGQTAEAMPEESKPGAESSARNSIAHTVPEASAASASSPAASKALPAPDLGSRPLRIAGLVTSAAGLAGIGAGVVFSVRTKSLSNSVSSATQFNSANARAGKQAATLQWVCYGAGGAAAVAGVLLYWRGRAQKREPSTVSFIPMVDATNAGLLVTGSF
jgi:hypothetical protein